MKGGGLFYGNNKNYAASYWQRTNGQQSCFRHHRLYGKSTENSKLISCYGCDSRTTDTEFVLAKREYITKTGRVRGADDVIAYLLRQSFATDIDYINRTLKVQRQLGKVIDTKKEDFVPNTFTKQEVRLKTPSSYRDLPIPDYVFEAILEQCKIYERNRSRRGKQFLDSGYVCCSNYGKPQSKEFHWKYYKQLLQENSLPDIRWHDLRSTFCTILLKNDFNPKAVSKLMN